MMESGYRRKTLLYTIASAVAFASLLAVPSDSEAFFKRRNARNCDVYYGTSYYSPYYHYSQPRAYYQYPQYGYSSPGYRSYYYTPAYQGYSTPAYRSYYYTPYGNYNTSPYYDRDSYYYYTPPANVQPVPNSVNNLGQSVTTPDSGQAQQALPATEIPVPNTNPVPPVDETPNTNPIPPVDETPNTDPVPPVDERPNTDPVPPVNENPNDVPSTNPIPDPVPPVEESKAVPKKRERKMNLSIEDKSFRPQEFVVPVNTTVIWKNNGDTPRVLVSSDNTWRSPVVTPGQTFSHTFREAGRFTYYSPTEPRIEGVIVVK